MQKIEIRHLTIGDFLMLCPAESLLTMSVFGGFDAVPFAVPPREKQIPIMPFGKCDQSNTQPSRAAPNHAPPRSAEPSDIAKELSGRRDEANGMRALSSRESSVTMCEHSRLQGVNISA